MRFLNYEIFFNNTFFCYKNNDVTLKAFQKDKKVFDPKILQQ